MELEDGMDESSSGESITSSNSSSSSSSSDDSSLDGSDNSSSSEENSEETTKVEDCRIDGANIQLPQGLCEHQDILRQVLSYETWQNLSEANKQHLRKFLPAFPSNQSAEEDTTLQLLFGGANLRFGSPLVDFHRGLKSGYYRPDISRMRNLLRKALNREYNYSQKRYYFRVMKSVLVSRQKLLQTANALPPGVNPKVPRLPAPPRTQQFSAREFRTRRRYFQELRAVRQEVGESGHSSEDENYNDGPPAQINKKLKRRLSTLEGSLCSDLKQVVSTLAAKPSGFDLAATVTLAQNPYELSDETYRNMLVRHKKRRISGDSHPELCTLGRTLQDIVDRVNRVISKKVSQGNASVKSEVQTSSPRLTIKPPVKRRNSKFHAETAPTPSPSHAMMADSSNNSDMAESDDDDSVMNEMERIRKEARDRRESVPDREKERRDLLREKEKEQERERLREKEKEREAEKILFTSSPRSTVSKGKKPTLSSPRTSKPNSLSGFPANRRVSKGDVDDILDSKPSKELGGQYQSSQLSSAQEQKQLQTQQMKVTQSKPSNVTQGMSPMAACEPHHVPVEKQKPPKPAPSHFSQNKRATILSDLSNIDMMSLPVDIEDPDTDVNVEDLPITPSLMQDTHTCFFSLIRDIICSATEQSMNLSSLQAGLRAWQESPISPLNVWYSLATGSDGWVSLLASALTFLAGQLPDMQPDEFVPYLEFKPLGNKYQWIGAGRDSDNHLLPLCSYWLERRDEASRQKKVRQTQPDTELFNQTLEEDVEVDEDDHAEELDRVGSPPPSTNPTNWVVCPSTDAEKEQFREQERKRFANPLRAFTYSMHDYESVVGPVKGVYSTGSGNIRPRGHSVLVPDRPNYVTILALVRDAAARLPNGQGTRMDICELLKDSQYLKDGAAEPVLQSVVSGALDRLHYESDPCVKYDVKRKIWIHLHRARSMEEFERMHHQQQNQGKVRSTRKANSRKKDKETKAESKAAAAGVSASVPRLASQIESDMPTGLQTIQVTTRPAVSASSSLWNTPMEITPMPCTSNQTTASTFTNTISNAAIASMDNSSSPSTSASNPRTILAARQLQASSPTRKATSKKKVSAVDAVDTVISTGRSVLGVADAMVPSSPKTTSQVIVGGKVVSAGSRKSIVMTTSAGIQQMVQLASASTRKPPPAGRNPIVSQPGTLLLSPSSSGVVGNTSGINTTANATTGTAVQWTANPNTGPRQAVLDQNPQQIQSQRTDPKRILMRSIESTPTSQSGISTPNETSAVKSAEQLSELDQHQLLQRQLQQKQQQNLHAQQQKTVLTQKQLREQTIQLLQQQLKEKPGTVSISNIQLVDQTGAVMAVQASESQSTAGRQRQNLVLVRQPGVDQAAQLSAMVQKQLVVLKQQRGQQGQQQTTLVNAVGGILPQQMFVVKSKSSTGQQKQVLTQLTAEQQAGLLALQRQKQLAQQQSQQEQPQQQTLQPSLPQQGKTAVIQRGNSLLTQNVVVTTASSASNTVTTASAKQCTTPMVAKVVTNQQGQSVITMEALLSQAQNKGTTLRVAAPGGKAGQANLIQLAGTNAGGVPQFAMVSQGGLISLAGSINPQRVVSQGLTLASAVRTTVANKVVAASSSTNSTPPTNNLRMVSAAGINIAHIGGKPVLLASKPQGLQGQNVILTTPSGGQQTVLLASQALRQAAPTANQASATVTAAATCPTAIGPSASNANTLVLQQQGGQQQILLPPGFQGGTINLKSLQGLQGLQGLKVIPIAQTQTGPTKGGRQQMYARIITPSAIRGTGIQAGQIQQTHVAVAGSGGNAPIATNSVTDHGTMPDGV